MSAHEAVNRHAEINPRGHQDDHRAIHHDHPVTRPPKCISDAPLARWTRFSLLGQPLQNTDRRADQLEDRSELSHDQEREPEALFEHPTVEARNLSEPTRLGEIVVLFKLDLGLERGANNKKDSAKEHQALDDKIRHSDIGNHHGHRSSAVVSVGHDLKASDGKVATHFRRRSFMLSERSPMLRLQREDRYRARVGGQDGNWQEGCDEGSQAAQESEDAEEREKRRGFGSDEAVGTFVRVEDSEIDPQEHDAYLAVIATRSEPLGDAMVTMSRFAGPAARTLDRADVAAAAEAMESVSVPASEFLLALSEVSCPAYFQGANDQIEGALRRTVRHAQEGAAAASAGSGAGVTDAATGIGTAINEIEDAAQRIIDWRSGAAR